MTKKLKTILFSSLAILAMNSIAAPAENMVWDADKPTSHMVKVKNVYTDQELISLFKKYDYYAVDLIEKNIIHIVINNQNYLFHNDSQNHNRFYIARPFENDLNLKLDILNEWNSQNIFNGYILENNVIVFSFMLDTEYGVSEDQIIELLKIGEDATIQLGQFMLDNKVNN